MEAVQHKEPLGSFVVLPPLRHAMVTLDPWEYSFSKLPNGKPDPRKTIHRLVSGIAYDVHDELTLRAFRECPGNQANGGNIFAEVQRGVLNHMRQLMGGTGASIPDGGLTADDRDMLRTLSSRKDLDTMPPPGIEGARKLYARAVERFRVAGIRHPKAEVSWQDMKLRIKDLLEVMAESGITVED